MGEDTPKLYKWRTAGDAFRCAVLLGILQAEQNRDGRLDAAASTNRVSEW